MSYKMPKCLGEMKKNKDGIFRCEIADKNICPHPYTCLRISQKKEE